MQSKVYIMQQSFKIDRFFLVVAASTLVLVVLSFFLLKPEISGDGITYINSIRFLETGEKTLDFFPNRLITTMGGMEIIIIFGKLFGSQTGVWLWMNIIFYIISSFVFYRLLHLVFENKKIALLGTLFLIGNYATLSFGLNYLMDMGGWMFYILSLFFTMRYAKNGEKRDLLLAALSVGVGGLFKEYALLGCIPIGLFLVYENRKSIVDIIKHSIIPALVATLPVAIVYTAVYFYFDYTYADWVNNSYQYDYSSSFLLRIAEYIKSLGSLYNILGVFVVGGLFVFWKEYSHLPNRTRLFVIGAVLSFLPVFFWGGVTQRILFITVPASIILASFLFKKYEQYFSLYIGAFLLYLILNFCIDSFILTRINLPF